MLLELRGMNAKKFPRLSANLRQHFLVLVLEGDGRSAVLKYVGVRCENVFPSL